MPTTTNHCKQPDTVFFQDVDRLNFLLPTGIAILEYWALYVTRSTRNNAAMEIPAH